jgi:hypothetical protein
MTRHAVRHLGIATSAFDSGGSFGNFEHVNIGAIIIIVIAASGILMMQFRKRWLAKINIVFTNRITGLFAGWLPEKRFLFATRSCSHRSAEYRGNIGHCRAGLTRLSPSQSASTAPQFMLEIPIASNSFRTKPRPYWLAGPMDLLHIQITRP